MRVSFFYVIVSGLVSVVLIALVTLVSQATARETIISVPPPISDEPVFIIGTRVLDLDGNIRRIGDEDSVRPAALVFLNSYCTISSRYLPELNVLAETARKAEVDFYGVFSDPQLSWEDIRKIRDDYGLTFPILFDVSGDIASRLKPLVTPEAFVVGANDRILYRGRIDNRFADIGKLRNKITKFELNETIHRVASQTKLEPTSTQAVGCFFEAWKKGPVGGVTYSRDIAPLLSANCVECHRPKGVAPFPLQTYQQASQRADMIAHLTGTGFMPPWRSDPAYGRFKDERILSQRQLELIKTWAEVGTPEGDPAHLPPEVKLPPTDAWRLGKPDIVLTLPEPYQVPATGPDIYRYFVIPSSMVKNEYMVALDFRPGEPSVVHHAIVYVDYSGRARHLDAEDPELGFSVSGTGDFMDWQSPSSNGYIIGGWSPGAYAHRYLEGYGVPLAKGGDIVLEVHYRVIGKTVHDQSTIALYFADEPLKMKGYVQGIIMGTNNINIPPGEENYWRHIWMKLPGGATLTHVTPHMHYLGAEIKAVATLPDGSKQPIIYVKDWDFRWQNKYSFRQPLHLPADTRIDVWFRHNNSADNIYNMSDPPERILWGWGSNQEMAEFFITLIPDNEYDREAIRRASWKSRTRRADSESSERALIIRSKPSAVPASTGRR